MENKLPYYSLWASVWDYRQKQIVADKSKSMNDIVSFKVYSIEGVEELQANPKYWINVCAANYYGVQSISLP